MDKNADLDLDLDLDQDLDQDLDDYVLHPQPQRSLRIVHAFMHKRAIEHLCEETVRIDDGVLRQEQLIWCIKKKQQQQFGLSRVHFKLRAMFLYNMGLEAEDVEDFLQTPPPMQQFLTPISAVEDVGIQPTIPMFARLNALHIMYEASNQCSNQASNQASNQGSNQGSNQASNQSKKRVILHSHHKKSNHTRRTHY